MDRATAETIRNKPEFRDLVARRGSFARRLTALMLAAYFAFILLVAFAPDLLGRRLGDSIITLGIPIGIGIILFAFALTGIYVRRANTEFDALTLSLRNAAEGKQ